MKLLGLLRCHRKYTTSSVKKILVRLITTVAAERKSIELAYKRAQNSLKPVNKVPDAILSEIFECYYDSMVDIRRGVSIAAERQDEALLKLMSVCHKWFTIATTQRSLWRDVMITPTTPVNKIRRHLERAPTGRI